MPARQLLVGGLVISTIAIVALAVYVARSGHDVLRLEIFAHGAYTLDGVPVERADLEGALMAHKRAGEEVIVRVVLSRDARYLDVYAALEALQKAGGQVGVVGNVAFYPSSQSSGARP